MGWEIYNILSWAALQRITELVEGSGSVVQVNDKSLIAPLRVKLIFKDTAMANGDS